MSAPPTGPLDLRLLTHADHAAMLAVCRACPVQAAFTLLFDRGDDIFAWPDRVFDRHRYVGAFVDGQLVGYLMMAWLRGWLGDRFGDYGYLGDARVLPDWRRRQVATTLGRALLEPPPEDIDVGYTLVAAGNRPAEATLEGRMGMRSGATLRVRNLPMWAAARWRRPDGHSVRPADDLEPLAALFQRTHAGRPFAPDLDAERLAARLHRYGRSVSDLLVVTRAGEVVAFGLPWDMAPFHLTRVLGYSAMGQLQRLAWNAAAAWSGAAGLPPPGDALRSLTLSTWAAQDAAALRALVAGIGEVHRHSGHHMLHAGIIAGDPLEAAFDGWWAPVFTSAVRYAEREGAQVPDGLPWLDLATI